MPFLSAIALALLLLFSPCSAAAGEPGDALTISVLTFGPGDHPFFKFGHNAILVHDELHHRDRVYNYGMFSFNSPWLIFDFLKGRLRYWLAGQSLMFTMANYREENRSIEAQELDLAPEQRFELVRLLEENAREENKYYKYDYYRDNCSTRVRDLLDRITNGRVRAVSQARASMSWRDHTRRLTVDNLPVYLGLHVAMGHLIDRPVAVWDEMFLPERLQQTLRLVTMATPQGDRPLVKKERVLLSAQRAPLRTQPPAWGLPFAMVGILIGAVFAGLGRWASRQTWARWSFTLLAAVFALGIGILGLIFCLLWGFTDHEVSYHNENILQCVPVAVVLLGTVFGLVKNRPRTVEFALRVVAVCAAVSLLGLLIKVLPWFRQDNWEIIALLLPSWVGLLVGLVLWQRAAACAAAPGVS